MIKRLLLIFPLVISLAIFSQEVEDKDSDVEEAGGAIGFGIVAALIISLLLAPFAIPPVSFGAAFREDERLDGAWECETGSFVLLI